MSDVQHTRYAILGAAGAMGALFARSLKAQGGHVTGFDLRAADDASPFDRFVVGDVLRADAPARDAWANAQVVLISLPHEPALAAVRLIAPQMSAGALVVDTLSVKSPVVEALGALGPLRCEYLSINPMFAPSLGFAGQKVVAVPVRPGDAAASFVRSMEGWGATVEQRSAEAHDRAAAVMQTATHLVLLLLGRAVRDGGVELRDLLSIAPPPHLMCLSMLSRILSAAPETYWDIQRDNPFGNEVRERLRASLAEFDALVRSNDAPGFAQELRSLRQHMEGAIPDLFAAGTAAIKGAKGAAKGAGSGSGAG